MKQQDDHLMREAVGQTLRMLRKARKLKQAEVAAHTGMDVSSYSRLESGDYDVSLPVFFRLCETLAFDPTEVVASIQHALRAIHALGLDKAGKEAHS